MQDAAVVSGFPKYVADSQQVLCRVRNQGVANTGGGDVTTCNLGRPAAVAGPQANGGEVNNTPRRRLATSQNDAAVGQSGRGVISHS